MLSSHTSRREFIRLGAAALAVAGVNGTVNAKEDDPFHGFKVGCQSYTFRNFKLEQAVKKIADLGLHYVEFYHGHVPVNSTPEQIKAVQSLCKEHDIVPAAFGVESFTKDHDANKKLFDFAAALGVKVLTADPSADSFDSLDKLVEEFKIAIAIHPHGPSGGTNRHHWWSAEVILKAIKDHNKLIGTCLDTGHLIRMTQLGETLDPVQQIKEMGARNFGIHLKDHNNKTKRDVVYGKDGGVLDVVAVLKALNDVKFTGCIAIEYEHNPADPTADVKACVEVVKESAKKLA